MEHRIILHDGAVRWLSAKSQTFFEGEGDARRPVRTVGANRDITERKQAEDQIHKHVMRLESLRTIDMAITASHDLDLTLNVVLQQTAAQLDVDAASILLFDEHMQMLECAATYGFRTPILEPKRLQMENNCAVRVVMERRMIHIADLNHDAVHFERKADISAENFISYYGIPLIAHNQVKGVLEVFQRTPLEADAEWLNFYAILAGQAAIAIDNGQLLIGLQRSNHELSLAYDATIEGWSRAMDLRDHETEGHTHRVTELTVQLAEAMNIHREQIIHIRRGALLHDMGKLGIPDNILLKAGKLSDEEWEIMRRHPQYAYEMLSSITYLRPALEIPYYHHEKWDGTGYPRGLQGREIPLAARLFAVVDVWDALLSARAYRGAWPKEKVVKHIRKESGSHFDPECAHLFLELMDDGALRIN